MSDNAQNKSIMTTKWKSVFSYAYLKSNENLENVIMSIRHELKIKPLLFLNLDQFQNSKRQTKKVKYNTEKESTLQLTIERLDNSSVSEIYQKQILLRVYPYFSISVERFIEMLDYIMNEISKRKISSGEMVGVIAAQSISERFTQTTLNSFHIAGCKKSASQMGIKRVIELLDALRTLVLPLIKNVFTKCPKSNIVFQTIGSVSDIFGIQYNYKGVGSKRNNFDLFFNDIPLKYKKNLNSNSKLSKFDFEIKTNDDKFCSLIIYNPVKMALSNIKKLVPKISSFHLSGCFNATELEDNTIYFKQGTMNYKTLELQDILESFPDVDLNKILPNDIHFIYQTYGIEATRTYILKEFPTVLAQEGIEIDHRHIMLLVDNMTYEGYIKPNKYGGIKIEESVILKASFEQATRTFATAASRGVVDNMNNISSQIILGQQAKIGASSCCKLITYQEVDKVVEQILLLPHDQVSSFDSPEYCPAPDSPVYHSTLDSPTYQPSSPSYQALDSPTYQPAPNSPTYQQGPELFIEPTFLI